MRCCQAGRAIRVITEFRVWSQGSHPVIAVEISRLHLTKKCAVKGAGLRRVQLQPGNWCAPPDGNRSRLFLRSSPGTTLTSCFPPLPGRWLIGASDSYLRESFAGRPTSNNIPIFRMGKTIGRSRFRPGSQQRACEIYCG